jgi:hypothetical protein
VRCASLVGDASNTRFGRVRSRSRFARAKNAGNGPRLTWSSYTGF